MILEQAFFLLPEILRGSGYLLQDYESGIVNAFTLGLLQELNGRNAPNPLAFLKTECLYVTTGNARPLRADLFLDSHNLRVANINLARYGWRHHNWLESKFFRDSAVFPDVHAKSKTTVTASILADLIRLACLVPETPGKASVSNRYFLHVYDAPPRLYVAGRRNGTKSPKVKGFARTWAQRIALPGHQPLDGFKLVDENPTLVEYLGEGISQLDMTLKINNLSIFPEHLDGDFEKLYWCVLTKILSFTVAHIEQDWSFSLESDRNVVENTEGARIRIRDFVLESLRTTSKVDTEPPDDAEIKTTPGEQQLEVDVGNT